jgi:hypothetical protein
LTDATHPSAARVVVVAEGELAWIVFHRDGTTEGWFAAWFTVDGFRCTQCGADVTDEIELAAAYIALSSRA